MDGFHCHQFRVDDRTSDRCRAVSPVVGVILMVALTIVLASVVAAMVLSFDDRLEEPEFGLENPWAGDPLLAPEDPRVGAEDVRYRVYFEVDEEPTGTHPLSSISITVDTEDDLFSGTDEEDLETFEIWVDGSTTDLSGDLNQWDEDADELQIRLTGAERLEEEGDVVEIVFGGVDNPGQAGLYDVTVEIDQGVWINEQEGELEIIPE